MDFVLYNLKLNIWTISGGPLNTVSLKYRILVCGPDFNDFNDGPPKPGSAELELKPNYKSKYE